MEKSNAPSNAKATVQAMGLKRRPSTRCRVKMGRYAVTMSSNCVKDRALNLMGGFKYLLLGRLGHIVCTAQVADNVFHHHHSSVHHHAKIQRAEGKQIRGNFAEVQADGGEQQGEWNGEGDD